MNENSVADIGDCGLCTACGTCVAVCPTGAIQMRETGSGSLAPDIDAALCINCGLCRRVCPGYHLLPGTLPEGVDAFVGEVKGAFLAQATDADLLRQAQSGGVATLALTHLLNSGKVDKALVTQMPADGRFRPRVVAAEDEENIAGARGSKYCPAAVNAALVETSSEEKVALVGCSCHVHGVRNAQQIGVLEQVDFTVGLFCDRTLSYALIPYLLNKADLDGTPCSLVYRHKDWRGWPGDVRIETREGDVRWLDRRHRMEAKDAFTLPHCRLCFDKLNVLSDISVGDAHGLSEGRKGMSAVLARTQKGLDLLRELERTGRLKLTQVDAQEISDQSQRIDARRRSWQQYSQAWRDMGRQVPDFGIAGRWAGHQRDVDTAHREQLAWSVVLNECVDLTQAVSMGRRRLSIDRFIRPLRPYRMRAPVRWVLNWWLGAWKR